MKTRTTEKSLYKDGVHQFAVRVESEGNGEFVEVSDALGGTTIRVNPDEVKALVSVMIEMANECEDGQ